MKNLTPRQAAVALALKEMAQYKEVNASSVHYHIEGSHAIFDKTGVGIGDISQSAVLDALRKFGLPARKLPAAHGYVFTNPFHGEVAAKITFRIDIHDAADPFHFIEAHEVEADTLEEASAEGDRIAAEINGDIGPGKACLPYGEDPVTGQNTHAATAVFVGTVISA